LLAIAAAAWYNARADDGISKTSPSMSVAISIAQARASGSPSTAKAHPGNVL
jgi:hypothetical protein